VAALAQSSGYIEIGQIDAFRDEACTYAITLSRVGVPVEFHLHPGAPHEFDSIAFNADVYRRASSAVSGDVVPYLLGHDDSVV
jgi:acetyl esterase/lipase